MKTTRRGMIQNSVGAMGAVLLDGAGAWAQESGAKPTAPPENPRTLAEALPFLDWESETRGTLLVVAPERGTLRRTVLVAGRDEPAETVRAGRNGFNLVRIAPRYGRKIAVVGSLSVVVPETMAVLRYKNLPKPDLWANVQPESRPQLLMATLSPAQWRTLMSPEGLGMGDLKRDQATIFAALFPDTMLAYRYNTPANGTDFPSITEIPNRTINRNTLRLRLYQDLQWQFRFRGNGGTLSLGDSLANRIKPTYTIQFQRGNSVYFGSGSGYYGDEEPAAFGAVFVESESNRPKPSDLDYDTTPLNRVISLSGAKTVGDLVTRVREATGAEVYADKRYAALPVYSHKV